MGKKHQKHRKQAVAKVVQTSNKVRRWLIKLNWLFIQLEVEKRRKQHE